MRWLLEIARTGLDAVLLHPLRSVVTAGALMVLLVPYLVGLAISQGVQEEAVASIRFGADLYVSGSQLGRPVPIPRGAADVIRRIEGVVKVVPRIVGGIYLGKDRENAVLVGLPLDELPPGLTCIEGRLPSNSAWHEVVVGTELARRLRLEVGSTIPPFYRNREGERLTKVVGLFRSDVSMWQARLLLTSFDAAAAIFDQRGLASDLLVYCRPGYDDGVRAAIVRTVALSAPEAPGTVVPHVIGREELQALLPVGLLHREGVFNLHYSLAFAVAILVILVTSGVGLAERRREIGILKATGWQTDEILLRGSVESLLLCLAAASASTLAAFVWLAGCNGYWIASIFLTGIDRCPTVQVPFRMTPLPVALAFLISFVVVMTGTLYSSWRSAITPPFAAIR
jgi:ABC-type lipoprotein release transport system permease subunit